MVVISWWHVCANRSVLLIFVLVNQQGPILEYELYDLNSDPFEMENLYATYEDKQFLTSLHVKLDRL